MHLFQNQWCGTSFTVEGTDSPHQNLCSLIKTCVLTLPMFHVVVPLASVRLPKHGHCKEVVEWRHLAGKGNHAEMMFRLRQFSGCCLAKSIPYSKALGSSPLPSPPPNPLTFCPGFSPCLATKGNSRAIFSYSCFSSCSRLTAKGVRSNFLCIIIVVACQDSRQWKLLMGVDCREDFHNHPCYIWQGC